MCGLAGILRVAAAGGDATYVLEATAAAMAGRLAHRGPDARASWAEGPVAFGFRRLSIIDPRGGDQPLRNEDGTVHVMVNGEIYDYVERREELGRAGHQFSTSSDAEVAVHAYEEWGLEFVERLRGMFALALWDARRRRLVLARDRLGQKPLYWSLDEAGRHLAFASELQALEAWAGLDRTLDPRALDDYLTFLYVPTPRSILRRVSKLPPAHFLVLAPGDEARGRTPTPQRYWHPPVRPVERPAPELDEAIRATLEEAVRLRLRSDVPLGTFLSGGIDSTIITALASRLRGTAGLDTFSLGFADPRFDESDVARRTAEILGTRHHAERLDATCFDPEDVAALLAALDEPFADSSILPTHWLSRWARRGVKVALSGDGGDELFAGYRRYLTHRRLERLARLPRPLLAVGEALAEALAAGGRGLGLVRAEDLRRLAKACRAARGDEVERVLALLAYFDEEAKARLLAPSVHAELRACAAEEAGDMLRDGSVETLRRQLAAVPAGHDSLDRLLRRDLATNLVDDGLVKVDRASMLASLEVRSPFLDHRFVELALTIPATEKLAPGRGGESKAILRRAFADLLPRHVLEQPKAGFEVPFAAWFQQPRWRSLLVDVLSADAVRRRGLFDPSAVIGLRDRFLDDPEARYQPLSAYQQRHRVWILFALELWCRRHLDATAGIAG